MIKTLPISIFVVLLTGLMSCKSSTEDTTAKPLAKVEDRVLTLNELEKAIPKNLSKNDSIAFTQNFINRWIKSSLLLRKAELNLTPEEKDMEQILADYRASLLIHKYQQKLLLQKYSPLISGKEIEAYYNTMNENFKLDKDIIQGIFIKVPFNAPNLPDLRTWYKSEDPDDYIKLEEYGFQNAQKFENFLDKWVSLDDIAKLFPEPLPNRRYFLNNYKNYESSDSLSRYFLSVTAYHKADEIAPLQYVEGKIKAILLNKKRIEFIQNLEEELYKEGLKQKIIKFY